MQNTDLIDTKEIARMLGMTRGYITGHVTKRPDFPKPLINMSQKTRRWSRADVMKFLRGGK
jgi:predicted DNA-binding transcriptional regulator AlpA